MKKCIIFLAICLMPFALMGQSYNVRMVVTDNNVLFYRGQSPLGITVPVSKFKIGAVTVTATGTQLNFVDATSSIQTQLNAKQATLVSATNIKTINSTSLLGSGDIVVAGATSVPTYFIAANNATDKEKQIADALCDGTADQVQINAALVAGYKVQLSTGQFNIAAAITAAVANITLEGSGKYSTTIFLSNGSNSNVILIGGNGWTIKNLTINGNLASNTGSDLCGIKGIAMQDIYIDNCEIKNVEDYAVFIRDASINWVITNSYIHNSGLNIAAMTYGATEPKDIKISNCIFSNTTAGSHVYIMGTSLTTFLNNVVIDNCKFSGVSGYMGAQFVRAKNCNVTNCYFDVDSVAGAGVPANIRYYQASSGTIGYNTFVGSGLSVEDFTNINIWGGKDIRIIGNYFTHLGTKRGSGIAIEAHADGYKVNNIIIEGNNFYNLSHTVTKPGIILYTANNHTVSNINIIGNNFMDDRGANAMCTYAIGTGGEGTIKNVNISDNIMEGMLDYGIQMMAPDSILNFNISNNIFIDIPLGIVADDGDDLQITGNKFVLCTTPIDVNNSNVTYPLIEGNTMRGCTNSGTYAGATSEIIGINVWHDGTYDNSPP